MIFFPFTVCIRNKSSLAGTQGPFKLSVRTAWEIAALEDVRLAPSPRPRQPAPAPVRAAGLCLTLPGPPRTQALQTGEGPTHGWGRCPSAPGCSVACGPSPLPPAPALVGHRWAGTWVSLVPVPTPDPGESRGQSWGVHPAARSHPTTLSRGKAGETPLPASGAGAAPLGPRVPPGRGATGGHSSDHTAPRPGVEPAVQLAQRPAGGERAGPPERSQTSGRQAVAGWRPCPTPLAA